jgi:hypothetical protein
MRLPFAQTTDVKPLLAPGRSTCTSFKLCTSSCGEKRLAIDFLPGTSLPAGSQKIISGNLAKNILICYKIK